VLVEFQLVFVVVEFLLVEFQLVFVVVEFLLVEFQLVLVQLQFVLLVILLVTAGRPSAARRGRRPPGSPPA
jgi:hypothetical protein